MSKLRLEGIAQLRRADIDFGDLTVLVGPQATGKSIALQFLKLLLDTGYIQGELSRYDLDWSRRLPDFLDIVFGEGMSSIWRPHDSSLMWNGKSIDLARIAARRRTSKQEQLFFIPAQRVLTLRDGWPRPFTDYSAGDPFSVRDFSEKLRWLLEGEFSGDGLLFPRERRLKNAYRHLLERDIFAKFALVIDKSSKQKRLVLGQREHPLPYMVWSAGQREFVPLLLGLYWLMPAARIARRDAIKWVVIEELEMGLHPQAIADVLLLVLELLSRDYRVCLSTHSPQVLELVWAVNRIRRRRGAAADVLDLFGLPDDLRAQLHQVADQSLRKRMRVYYFDRPKGLVHDISALDPASQNMQEARWGGLSDFSQHANEVVARVSATS
jgi:putative AbiEii toxin of type IV toxin-antitoxin system